MFQWQKISREISGEKSRENGTKWKLKLTISLVVNRDWESWVTSLHHVFFQPPNFFTFVFTGQIIYLILLGHILDTWGSEHEGRKVRKKWRKRKRRKGTGCHFSSTISFSITFSLVPFFFLLLSLYFTVPFLIYY